MATQVVKEFKVYREMQRYGRILMILAFAIGIFVIGMTPDAYAGFVLTLDDTSTGGIDVIVSDNTGIGFVTASGLVTNIADVDATLGNIALFSATVGGFSVSLTGGTSKPIFPDPPAQIDQLTLVATGSGTLVVSLTDTGFSAGQSGIVSSVGGTLSVGSTVTVGAIMDHGNGELGSVGPSFAVPLVLGGPGGGFFGGNTSVGSPVAPGPFSLTSIVTLVSVGGSNSWDHNVTTTPEPSTLLLLGIGLCGFGVLRWRRQKKS